MIETMTDVAEAQVAIRAARTVTALPVVVTMTFRRDGRTMAGGDPAEAAVLLAEAGAAAVGANCGAGPAALLPVIERLRAALPDLPLVALQSNERREDAPPEQAAGQYASPQLGPLLGCPSAYRTSPPTMSIAASAIGLTSRLSDYFGRQGRGHVLSRRT